MVKGVWVHVYRNGLGDCTNGGVSSRTDSFLLVDSQNPSLGQREAKEGDTVLVVDHRCGMSHPCLTPRAVPAVIREGIPEILAGWSMFGGNFVSTSDAWFSGLFGHVLPIHDRFER